MRTLGGAILTKRERKTILQVMLLFLNQRKQVHSLHQGYGYTLQNMIEKGLKIIRTSVAKYVKYLNPLLSVVDVRRKPRDALKLKRVSILLTSLVRI